MPERFERGRLYRRTDLHQELGGQERSGIVTPRDQPVILIFTGESGKQHGYRDELTEDGVFIYTGEGQVGDMQFVRGNRAIRDHIKDGKEVHLFDILGRPKGFVRYRGQFAADSWHEERLVDREGKHRRAIRFHLVPVEEGSSVGSPDPSTPLSELRERALAAAAGTTVRRAGEAARSYYERSRAVATYVLARAAGVCEACQVPAPFKRKDGTPYLEPHHTRRLADGGPDHPRWVGGICPTCHRRIHYGEDGAALNAALEQALAKAEGE